MERRRENLGLSLPRLALRLPWTRDQRPCQPRPGGGRARSGCVGAAPALVVAVPALPGRGRAWLAAPVAGAVAPIAGGLAVAEIGGDQRRHEMQPYVATLDRQQAQVGM